MAATRIYGVLLITENGKYETVLENLYSTEEKAFDYACRYIDNNYMLSGREIYVHFITQDLIREIVIGGGYARAQIIDFKFHY